MIDAVTIPLLLLFLSGGRGGGGGKGGGSKNRGDVPPAGEVYEEGAWPRAVPKGGERPIKNTGGPTVADWRRSRFQACIDFLMNDDRSLDAITNLSAHNVITTEQFSMDGIALSAVAHWDIETASGTAEFNFNVGGVAAVPGQQFFLASDVGDPTSKVAFCAYDSLQEGIADYFGVLSYDRFVHALAPLLVMPTDPAWFGELGQAGYYALQSAQYPNALTLQEAMGALAARRQLVATDVGSNQ